MVHPRLAGSFRHIVEIAVRIRRGQVGGHRHHRVTDGEYTDHTLDGAGGGNEMPHLALRRADRDLLRGVSEHGLDGVGLSEIVHFCRGAVRVDVIDLFDRCLGVLQCPPNRLDGAVPEGWESVIRYELSEFPSPASSA